MITLIYAQTYVEDHKDSHSSQLIGKRELKLPNSLPSTISPLSSAMQWQLYGGEKLHSRVLNIPLLLHLGNTILLRAAALAVRASATAAL